jgi:hypothetical protein
MKFSPSPFATISGLSLRMAKMVCGISQTDAERVGPANYGTRLADASRGSPLIVVIKQFCRYLGVGLGNELYPSLIKIP